MIREMAKTVPCRALWHRGGNGCWHCVFAQPGGVLHQRHHAAHRRRAPTGAVGYPMRVPDAAVQARAAVKPFSGFHRPTPLKFFQV
jgi:hypothetical protein